MLPRADLMAAYTSDWLAHRHSRLAGALRRHDFAAASALADAILDEIYPFRWSR